MARLNVSRSPLESDRDSVIAGYLERVAKYVPAEVIAAYLFFRGMSLDSRIHVGAYVALLILAVAYLWKFGGQVPQKGKQVFVCVISFLVWTYAIGGPVFAVFSSVLKFNIEDNAVGSVAVVLWSLATAVIVPSPEKAPVAQT